LKELFEMSTIYQGNGSQAIDDVWAWTNEIDIKKTDPRFCKLIYYL
jgi:hypothetical protein